MLRIVTDSAGDMPPDWPEKYDYQVIPVNIHFGEQTFLQGIDLTDAEFYALVEKSGIIPQTSQPSPHQFMTFYRRIAEPGDTILSIHVTSELSGTYASAEMAARELAGKYDIIAFDSKAGSAALAYMCREAREMEGAGATTETILDRLRAIRDNLSIILTLDSLEYAQKSGRVRALQAAIASVLRIKPIIALEDGVLEMAGQVRTRKRALNQVLEMMARRYGSTLINAAVVQAMDPIAGNRLMEQVAEKFNCHNLIMTELSTGVAANLGPGTVGMIAYATAGGF